MAESKLEIVIAARYEAAEAFQRAGGELAQFRRDAAKNDFDLASDSRDHAAKMRADIERRANAAESGAGTAIGDARMQILRHEALLGDEGAKNTLNRLRLESQQASERERLVAITKNALVTDQSRLLAAQELVKLDAVHAKQIQAMEAARNAVPTGGAAAHGTGGVLFKKQRKQAKTFIKNVKFLMGGAELGMFDALGHHLAHAVDLAGELADKFHEGKITGLEMVHDLAAGLPVMGGFVSLGESIRGYFDGSAEALKKINEEAKKAGEEAKRQDSINSAITSLVAGKKAAERASELAGLDAFGRQRKEMEYKLADDLAKIEEQRKSLVKNKVAPASASQKSAAQESVDRIIGEATDAAYNEFSDKRDAMIKTRAEERADASAKEQAAISKSMEEEQARGEERTSKLDAEIKVKELESQGKHLDAKLEQIRAHYAKAIGEARTFDEEEQLIKLRGLDEQEAKKADQIKKQGSREGINTIGELTSSFMGLADLYKGGADPQIEIAANTKRAADKADAAENVRNKTLQAIIDLATAYGSVSSAGRELVL